MPLIPPALDKLTGLTRDIMKQRTEKNIRTQDFLQTLMDLMKDVKENPEKG